MLNPSTWQIKEKREKNIRSSLSWGLVANYIAIREKTLWLKLKFFRFLWTLNGMLDKKILWEDRFWSKWMWVFLLQENFKVIYWPADSHCWLPKIITLIIWPPSLKNYFKHWDVIDLRCKKDVFLKESSRHDLNVFWRQKKQSLNFVHESDFGFSRERFFQKIFAR